MAEKNRPKVEIRRFRSGDGDRIRELNEVAMAPTPEYVPGAPDEDLHKVQTHYLDSGGEFLVGTADGSIIGMGAYTTPKEWKEVYVNLDSQTAELTRMRVDPEWHRRGVGGALYHELEQRALDDGFEQFVLDTGAENDRARGFYKSLGFQLQQEVSVDYGSLTLELALYQKPLDT